MSINIGINGFGRIGRLVFRSAINDNNFKVISINDLLDIEHLAYLLKYDSVHGSFDGSVEISNNNLIVNLKNYQSEKIGLYFSFFIHKNNLVLMSPTHD